MITGLIINRFKGKGQILDDLTNQAVENYKKDNAMYLLQGVMTKQAPLFHGKNNFGLFIYVDCLTS